MSISGMSYYHMYRAGLYGKDPFDLFKEIAKLLNRFTTFIQNLFSTPQQEASPLTQERVSVDTTGLISKVKELFTGKIEEVIEYSHADLKSAGTRNSSGKLKPFTNFGATSPYTYTSNLTTSSNAEEIAAQVIRTYLTVEGHENPFEVLQRELSGKNPRASQVAAVLHQVGDSLSPLPNDSKINMALAAHNGFVDFDPKQKGNINFTISANTNRSLELTVNSESVDVKDISGKAICSFISQRRISVELPTVDGTLKCVITRQYAPEVL